MGDSIVDMPRWEAWQKNSICRNAQDIERGRREDKPVFMIRRSPGPIQLHADALALRIARRFGRRMR